MSAVDVLSALIAPAAGAAPTADGEADAPAFERALGLFAGDRRRPAVLGEAPAAAPGLLRTLAVLTRPGATPGGTGPSVAAETAGTLEGLPSVPTAPPAEPTRDGARPVLEKALDAFGQALKEALGSEEDGRGLALGQLVQPDGTLPPKVQAALDKVIASAPPEVGTKLQALVARFLAPPSVDAAVPAPPAPPANAAALAAQPLASGETPARPAAPNAASAAGLIAALRQVAGQGRPDGRPLAAPTVAEIESRLRAVRSGETAAKPTAKDQAPPAAAPSAVAERQAPTFQPQTGAPPSPDKATGGATPEVQALATGAAPSDTPESPAAGEVPAQAAAAPSDARAAAAVVARGSPETVAHLAAQIVRRLEGRSTRFDIELHPNDLGAVDVRLEIGADGRLAAQLAFDNPAAATDLRARADELRRMLEQAGFNVAEDALSFSEREAGGFDRHAREQAEQGRGRRAFQDGERTALAADTDIIGRRGRDVALGVDVRI
ncbi:MAG TPA: flagellar hook-length control protein FliK [Caulobacteraceae bacterium]|nr:flagellar hook-length control protein FliK [Caulobacteraceae bacterium]